MVTRFVNAQTICLAAALLLTPTAASGRTPARIRREAQFAPIVLVDLIPSDNENPVATRVFSFTEEDDEPVVTQMMALVRSLNSNSPASIQRALSFLRQHGEELSTHTSSRWVSHQGDSVNVIVFHPEDQLPTITFEEAARESRLSADLDSLIETAGSITTLEAAAARRTVAITRRKYRLRNGRAVLKITAQTSRDSEGKGSDEDKEPPVITSIVTGPSERVFLSANAAYTKVRQVKYNSSEDTFEPGHKPTELLLGINYSLHDVFQNERSTGIGAFVQGVYFGFLMEPSRRPFNQIATTIGFRHSPPPFESLFSLETVSPYIGLVWARDDVPDASSENHVKTRYGKRALIMGFALGLDRALGWLEGTQ